MSTKPRQILERDHASSWRSRLCLSRLMRDCATWSVRPDDTDDMKSLPDLFGNNRTWAARCLEEDAALSCRLCELQSPRFLWIGCAGSRSSYTDGSTISTTIW